MAGKLLFLCRKNIWRRRMTLTYFISKLSTLLGCARNLRRIPADITSLRVVTSSP